MTLAQFFGYSMITFGAPFAMFVLTIANDPIRIIMFIASAIFWLLSLLFSALLYQIVYNLKETVAFGALFSVLFQELFRFLWWLLLSKAHNGLKKVSGSDAEGIFNNKHILAYVSGLGFGTISGVFSLLNVLADMTGPGTIGLFGDPPYFFLASFLIGYASINIQIFWSILFFDSFNRKKYLPAVYVLLSHILFTSITLLNPMYSVTVPCCWALMIVSGLYAFKVAGGSLKNVRLAFAPRVVSVDAQDSQSSSVQNS